MTNAQTCPDLCPCDECAELDLAYPGEGRQLALPGDQLLQTRELRPARDCFAECRP